MMSNNNGHLVISALVFFLYFIKLKRLRNLFSNLVF